MHSVSCAVHEAETLSDLRDALIEHAAYVGRVEGEDPALAAEVDGEVDWTRLKVFGGEEPPDTNGIWSWDETSLLRGTCADDLEIIPRPLR